MIEIAHSEEKSQRPYSLEDWLNSIPMPNSTFWDKSKRKYMSVLECNFVFVDSAGERHTVPKGFVYDGKSSPKLSWFYSPPYGKDHPAVVAHDWLYQTKATSRKVADQTLMDISKACGVRPTKALVEYCMVRVFGLMRWHRE